MVLGEHGPARKNSGSHEHPDESSFMIAGFGEMLALDSGYICWEEHNLVNNAYNHNMILVDGEGPQKYYDLFPYLGGVDAFLSDFSGNPSMPRVTVSTNYQETDVIRKFYFPESSYFVVVDHLISNTPVDRKFELLIHGNGLSSEGSFTLTDDGGEWHTGNVLFTCSVTSQSSLNYREEIYINSFYYGQKLNHSCLVVEATGRDVTFTSVLVPTLISDGIRPEITCDGKFLNVKIGNHEDYFNIENGELK
jgi:hypothetical protein